MPALIRAAAIHTAIHPPPERGRGILAYNRLNGDNRGALRKGGVNSNDSPIFINEQLLRRLLRCIRNSIIHNSKDIYSHNTRLSS